MKLWKVHIKTYHFGNSYYDLFVLADTENNMLKTVYKHPAYRNDEDAEIVNYREIDFDNHINRVL
jgi:hypothetical protein